MKREVNIHEDGSKSIYTYDTRGNEVHRAYFDNAGNFKGENIYSYDTLGRCEGWIVYDSQGEIIRYFEQSFEHDSFTVVEVIEKDSNGNELSRNKNPLE